MVAEEASGAIYDVFRGLRGRASGNSKGLCPFQGSRRLVHGRILGFRGLELAAEGPAHGVGQWHAPTSDSV